MSTGHFQRPRKLSSDAFNPVETTSIALPATPAMTFPVAFPTSVENCTIASRAGGHSR